MEGKVGRNFDIGKLLFQLLNYPARIPHCHTICRRSIPNNLNVKELCFKR